MITHQHHNHKTITITKIRSTSSIAKSLAQLHSNIKDRSTYSTTNINTKQIPKKRKKSHLINPNNNKKATPIKIIWF